MGSNRNASPIFHRQQAGTLHFSISYPSSILGFAAKSENPVWPTNCSIYYIALSEIDSCCDWDRITLLPEEPASTDDAVAEPE